MTGDSAPSAKAMGVSVDLVRFLATTLGGFLAGVGGAFLSLYYPGSWNQGPFLGSGTDGGRARDLRALEPDPLRRRRAAVRRCGRDRPGIAIGRRHARAITSSTAAPYILTLFIMIASAGSKQAMREVPAN